MYLPWIDLEMTGLNPNEDVIVEIAALVTNEDLTEVIEGPNIVIHQDQKVLNNMSETVKKMHEESGLLNKISQSRITVKEAESQVYEFLIQYIKPGQRPLCGNSIGTDIIFLKRHMSKLASLFHYRSLDVTSLKLCTMMWNKQLQPFQKKNTHRAMDDIKESVAELTYYKKNIYEKSSE